MFFKLNCACTIGPVHDNLLLIQKELFCSRHNFSTRLLLLSSKALAGIKPCGDLYEPILHIHVIILNIYPGSYPLASLISASFDVHGNYLSHFPHLLQGLHGKGSWDSLKPRRDSCHIFTTTSFPGETVVSPKQKLNWNSILD